MSDAKIDIRIEPAADGTARAELIFLDPKLHGHEAVFSLIARVSVHDARPVNDSKTVFEHPFRIAQDRYSVDIPHDAFKTFSYSGEKIEIYLGARVEVDDGYFTDTQVEERVERALGTKPTISTDAQELTSPKDAFHFGDNLKAIPVVNRIITVALLAVGAVIVAVNTLVGVHDQFVPEPMTYVYSHTNSDGESQSPLVGSLAVSGGAGLVVWLMIRAQLRKYMRIGFKPMPDEITRGMHFSVSEFVHGRPRVPLEDVVVRVVACNMEKGQYKRGSGTKERTVSFCEPCRAVVLFEKTLTLVPARAELETYLTDAFSFDPMFAALYPPNETTSSHGLTVHWEVQVLHPRFVDHELVGPSEMFRYNDFLAG